MLILPRQTEFSLRALPFVTLILVLVHAAVYFYFQRSDGGAERTIVAAYARTELPAVEVPRYRAWLERQVQRAPRERLRSLQTEPQLAPLLMLEDPLFLRELRGGRLVPATDPQYPRWRAERQQIDEQLRGLFRERFSLSAPTAAEPWRYLTYGFIHPHWVAWLGATLVLLLVGPFVEARLGALRFAAAYLAAGALAGAAFLVASPGTLVGTAGILAGLAGALLVLYGAQQTTAYYTLGARSGVFSAPAAVLVVVWLLNELAQWLAADDGSQLVYAVQFTGLIGGALSAWLMKRPPQKTEATAAQDEPATEPPQRSGIASEDAMHLEAEDAAARMDLQRAARVYRNLLQIHPSNVKYLTGYFRVALASGDADVTSDAAVRVLNYRGNEINDEMNKAYLSMSQPRIVAMLPVEEQLRLARRLVRTRDDETALRVLDRLLEDGELRALYGRQIADCLLGVFTAYARYGLKTQAEQVRVRLATHFRPPTEVAPATRVAQESDAIDVNTRPLELRPDTVYMDYNSR